jgi:hypothetical protein
MFWLQNSVNPSNAKLNPICHLLIFLGDLTFMGSCIVSIFQYIYPTRCSVTQFIYIWKLLLFRVVLPPIIRSSYTCTYSIWYLSHRYCYLPLSWKSWNRFECAVGDVRHIPDALPPGKTRRPLYRRLGGPQGRSGRVWTISSPPGFNPRPVQPVASRYTDWHIRAPA